MAYTEDPQCPTEKTMDFDSVINYFGSQVAAAAALGVTQPTISMWRSRGSIPQLQQLRIQHITDGRLRADKDILGRKRARTVSRA